MQAFIGPKLRTILRLVGFFLICQFAYRLGFTYWFSQTAQDYVAADLRYALYLGFKFDLRMSLFYALPLALLIFINPHKYKKAKRFWVWLYTIAFFVMNSCYIMDAGYYSYLNSRINGTALRFLANPIISIQMLWETYPVVQITLANICITVIGYFILKYWVFRKERPFMFAPSFTKYISFGIGFIIFLLGIYGKFSYYPLRWSEAFFANNTFISATALHPIHYFIDSYNASKITFEPEKVKAHYEQVSNYLGVTEKNKEQMNFKRRQKPTPLWQDKKPNVVVIVLESFSAYKSGITNNPLNPTPYFDELANSGLLFNRFFVPSEGTARSMFSLISGIPDVTSYRTSSRNPLITEQNSAVNALQDYSKLYFLGGSANWGEIRGVIASSIPGIKIFEEGMFESPRTDVWGISDLDLFKEAHKHLSQLEKDKPFFALIQSAGFHRPYTIPENSDDFVVLEKDPEEVKKYGFISTDEFNSIRFEDFAFGKFIQLAKSADYFENTIFIVIGDHGLPSANAQHLSKGYIHHSLARFHVPLLFYGPNFFQPEVNNTIATETDVLTSIAAITGHEYLNKGLGRNLFDDSFDRAALMFVYHSIPKQIKLITDNFIATGNLKTGITGLFEWNSNEAPRDIRSENLEEFAKLKSLAEGLYETSRFMLYNNKIENVNPPAVTPNTPDENSP